MTTLGQAYVQIMPSAQGVSGSIQKTINPEATAAGKSAGRNIATSISESMSSAGKTLTKAITIPALGAATAVSGIVSAFGWGRLKSVDSAQAQLRGLGYETEDVQRISDQLAGALEGGMLTMGEATSAAATAMASGVEEGKELTRYIQILDGTVAGSTGTFEEMEQIFGRIVDQGNITRNEFDMIAQRMPGFSKAVQDNMDISSDEMYEMLRNGEITTNQFLDIMEDFSGDMATEYAKSWEGMVQNTIAYIGILGENLLGGVFEQSKESIAEFIEFLSSDKVISWAQEVGQSIGDTFSRVVESVMSAINWWTSLEVSTQKMIMTIAGIAVAIGPVLIIVGKLITAVMSLSKWFGLIKVGAGIVSTAIGAISAPVLAIIGVIAGLIAIFTTLYQKNEGFRNLVQTAWAKIQETISMVIQTISDFVMSIFGSLVTWWNENNQMILQAAQNVWNVISTVITTVMNVIWGIMQSLWPVIQALIVSTWNAIKGVIEGAINVITGIIEFFAALFTGNWSALWDSVKKIVSGAVQFVWNFIQLSFVGKILKVIRSFAKTFSKVIKDKWDTVRLAFMYAIDFIKGLITRGFGAVRNTVTSIMNAVRGVISNIWNAIRSVISSVLNGIRSTVSSIWNGIKSVISSVVNSIRNTVRNIFNSLRSIVSSAFNRVRSAVSSGIRNAYNTVINFVSRFRNAGRRIVTSIADGIRGAISSVTGAISSVASTVRDFLPFSPPERGPLMDIMDVKWGETIGSGIEKGEKDVAKAMEKTLNFDLTKQAQFSGATPQDSRYADNRMINITVDAENMTELQQVVELFTGLKQSYNAN